jgi:hypothetical protein
MENDRINGRARTVFGLLMSTLIPSLVVVRPPVLHTTFPDLLTLYGVGMRIWAFAQRTKSQFLTWTTETSSTPDGQLYAEPLLNPKAASGRVRRQAEHPFLFTCAYTPMDRPWIEGVRDAGGLSKPATRFFD